MAIPPPPLTPDAAEAVAPPADAAAATLPPRDAAGSAGRPRPPDAATPKDDPDDEGIKKQLDDAEAALAGGQLDRAERLANSVIQSTDAKARQRAHAHLIRGIVKCTQEQDQEAATAALRNLGAHRAYQKRLRDTCKRAGVELR